MKMSKLIVSSASVAGMTFLASSAYAQAEAAVAVEAPAAEAPAVEATAEAAAAPEGAEAPAEEVAQAEEAPVEEASAEEPAAEEPAAEEEPMEEEVGEEEAAAPEEAEAAEDAEDEGGTPTLFVFADAWAGAQTSPVGTPGGAIYAHEGASGGSQNGFGLNWLGADIGYDGGTWAVNGSLRWGDAVAIYGTDTLGPITSAYATWKPTESFSIDAGAFGTIYGAEVAESWQNLNYTRGQLYFNYQPFWHTGVKASYDGGGFSVTGLVANKANNASLGQNPLEVGLQLGLAPSDSLSIAIGALQTTAPNATGTDFVDTFFDLVVAYTPGDFSLIGNADFNIGYGDNTAQFWGASLAAGYAFAPAFGVALRGEVIGDDAGRDLTATGTLTLDLKPAGNDNLIVRWDNRVEFTDAGYGDPTDPSDIWFGSTLGFVALADLL